MFGFETCRLDRARASRYRALATLLDGGITLRSALERVRTAAVSSDRRGERSDSEQLRDGVAIGELIAGRGESPSLAAERAAIDAASRGGELPAALRDLADDLDTSLAARRLALGRIAYPLLLLHLLPIAVTITDLLAKPARFVGRVALAYVLLWALLAGTAALLAALRRSERGTAALARWPTLGRPLTLGTRARFFRLLALLEGAGVLRQEALATATTAIGPAVAVDGYREFGRRAQRGDPPEQVVAALVHLPIEEQGELAAAMTVGALEAAARRIATRASEQWQAATLRLAKLVGSVAYGAAVLLVFASLIRFYSGYFARFSPPR